MDARRDSERLYREDSLLVAFEATVARHGAHGGRRTVVLDRTAFYPESGGQMADRGKLDDRAVLDVQADDDGSIHHLVEEPLPPVGRLVRGAEDLANAVVDDDLVVRAWFPAEHELAELPLRREAKVAGPVRVVGVGDFDLTPCGGTHCRRSAEVGLVRITSAERYKGGLRITFVAGKRARDELGTHARALRAVGRVLSCPPLDVAQAVAPLNRVVMLAGIAADGVHVMVARGSESSVDCGALVKRAAEASGGRGGGRADRAEGRLPSGVDWPALVAKLGDS